MATEVERLVARLVGDSSSYSDMLRNAQQQASQAATEVERYAGRIEQISDAIKGFGASALATLGALGTLGRLKDAFGAFAEQEKAEFRLTAAIEANEGAVESQMDAYKAFATEMQRVTTTGDQTVLSLIAQAEQFGVTGDAAKRAARNVIAARATGTPLNIRQAVGLEQGEVGRLGYVFPGLRHIKDQADKVAYVQDKLDKMFKSAEAESGTAAGQIQQLTNAYRNFKEELGSVVANGLKPVVGWLKEGVIWLHSQSSEFKTNIVVVMALITAILGLIPLGRLLMAVYGTALFNPLTLGLIAATAAVIIFTHEVGGWSKALEIAKRWIDNVVDGVGVWYKLTVDFIEENKKLFLGLTILAITIIAVYTATKVGIFIFGILEAAFVALRIQQIATITAMVLWKGVVIAATIVIAAFNAFQAEGIAIWTLEKAEIIASAIALGIWKAVVLTAKIGIALLYVSLAILATMFGSTTAAAVLYEAAMLAWSGVMVIAQAATWLFNGALSATNILLGAASIIAATIAIVALAAAFALAGAAVYAVVSTASILLDVLLGLPTSYGPIAHILGLFFQWWDILKDVYGVMTIDLDLATKLLAAGFELAVNQIRDLWPPLWRFIQDGWAALTQLASKYMEFEFYRAIIKIGQFMYQTIEEASGGHVKISDEVKEHMKKTLEGINEIEMGVVNDATVRLAQAINAFKVFESGETAGARIKVEQLQREAKKKIEEGRKEAEPEAYDYGQAIGEQIGRGLKDSKFDAVLRSSAEAITRMAHFMDITAGEALDKSKPLQARAAGGDVAMNNDRIPNLLVQIRDELKNKEAVEFQEAGLA